MGITHVPRPLAALKSVRTWIVAAVTVGFLVAVGFFFFLQGRSVMHGFVRERLTSVAAVAAFQFPGEDIEHIHTKDDMGSPLFKTLVQRMKKIRSDVSDIRYVYILRRTENPLELEFVVDADALDSLEETDINRDGVIDPSEQQSFPGDRYDISGIPILQKDAFIRPTADVGITRDQWGETFSGYAPIRDASGRVVAVIGIDMTAQNYEGFLQAFFSTQALFLFLLGAGVIAFYILVMQWRTRAEELEQLNEERSWLMQLVLHQVGTPLTIFKWAVESLEEICQRASGEGVAEAKEDMELMKDGISRLEHVTDVLLTADRVQAGTFTVHKERAFLQDVIAEGMKGVRAQLDRRHQTITLHVEQGIELKLDSKLLAGVIRELLDNAMTYSPNGGNITMNAERRGKVVEIRVIDQGCGISKEDLTRVFQRFARGTHAGEYDPNGTGIGLYIARGIIERFGGEIHIRSTEGKGATIVITLPLP
ncbi:MAG: HAMP domain-containing sensor histidine kinase [Candidatus Peribacteraceae bacterium]|nr:HAMP domain-containing sensor histidine kinase [Candidatus Peribacteraceae bacterium]MDD5075295.1 HAMP domain-containing sensor histidine kinase [Candidatus Peribacteraceae bacterium]